jgi:UDP-N-acetylglucosamine 4,6-dehydratase|tara:strand:+ start:416 stop:1405 length:990 start_codon:yes stop_codon:yes gene_type:complete
MYKNKSILITGGTGSFGKNFVNYLLKKSFFNKIIIFSRDELKQYEMKKLFKNHPKLRFFIGDVRDVDRLKMALSKIDYVVHAAALKQVDTGEYNPFEFIKTNIMGAQNLIEASFYSNVKKIIALSTDKASSPINLYGATKLCSDKLFCSANAMLGDKKTIYSVIRYGNVMFSRGSVIPLFKDIRNNEYPVTDTKMTRFSISMNEAIDLVMWSLENSAGGEIIVPKIPSYKIVELIKAFSHKPKIKIIGIRRGEKIHEEMISSEESRNCLEIDGKYIIVSNELSEYTKKIKNKKLIKKFSKKSYKSNENIFLDAKDLLKAINKESKNFIL